MKTQEDLQILLEETVGSRNVYYQPPANIKMNYPCIRYSKSNERVDYANNHAYMRKNAYEITVIDEYPDNEMVKKISDLPLCKFNRQYVADGMYHDVYVLFY